MAANMQHMAAAGQMMPQQMRKPNQNSALQQYVYTYLMQNTPPTNGMSWQANVTIGTRLGNALNLITNITLAMNGVNQQQAADYGAKFEKDSFIGSPSKEAYEQALSAKRLEFFKKRQANEPLIQNNMNANAQAQAQAAQAQAQAMMNMQNQMGRGQGPQQNFQQLQQQMQASQMPQQQQPQQHQMQQQAHQAAQQQAAPQPPQQMNMNMMGMGMGMGNQAGRGMNPNAQMGMGMQAGQNRPQQPFANDISRLAHTDKSKVADLASKIMAQAPEEQKAELRMQLQQRMPAHQLAEIQASGKDPLIWFYQNQAFQVLKANMAKLGQQQQQQQQQGRAPNQNPAQPAMMQQQNSQQSIQQRQNMMNGAQQGQPGNDFSQFANMESIKDQQLNGLMAQQAGQMVVPASAAGNRNPTPQNMNQNMPPNQPGPNQTPRPQQQQVPQQHTPQQAQPQPGLNMQQMKMNQNQAQLQAQAHMKQMQGQPAGMGGGMPPSQSPGMNNLNTPAARPPNNMNPMANQAMGQGNVQFGDQRFNQGIQRPNSQAFNAMLSNMSPEQRQTVNGLPPDKLNEVMRRWQTQREQQIAMNAGQMNQGQMPNLQQNQFNPMGQNAPGPSPQAAMQQQTGPQGGAGQQPMQTPRGPPQNGAAAAMMDAMDLPPQVVNQIGRLPPEVKKWKDLKVWLSQTNTNMPQQMRSSLGSLQQRQFQLVMQRRAAAMPTQPGQPPAMNAGNAPTPGGQMANMQPGMQRPMGNFPPQVLQVSPQELMQVRSRGGQFAALGDDQLRAMVVQMKKQTWSNQQMQLRAQQGQMQPQQPGMPNQMSMPQAPMQLKQPPQPNQPPQPQPVTQPQPAGPPMAQPAVMQPGGQRPARTPDQQVRNGRQQPNNRAQPPNPSPAQGARNLKRPSTDDTADASTAAKPTGPTQRPGQQQQQQQQQQQPNQQPNQQAPRPLSQQQIAGLTPEQRAKYEQVMMRAQMAKGGAQGPNGQAAQAGNQEVLARLKTLGQEEHQQFTQEVAQDVPMSTQEYNEMAPKLRRLVVDVHKIGRGLNKWYALTRDDPRARMFFRIRLRIINQFEDGEAGEVMKNPLSVRSTELDNFRAMLESMAKDLAASVYGRTHMKPQQGTPANAANQLPQQQQMAQQQQAQQTQAQGQPAPLNAANLEKNTQALNKMRKGSGKAAQAPAAPTATQPPFSFGGASSPHGNPSYVGQPRDMNLQLPPARKKQKKASEQVGKTGATPSPQIGKNASPEMQRATEPQQQPPAKPVFLCRDPECDKLSVGFPNEKSLQRHIEDEHTKPRENPVKFVGEILASALGLEPDGTAKKDQRPAAQAMSTTNSKQGQTPSNLAGTPKSQDASMKRSASALGKPADAKKPGVSFQAGSKEMEAADPWAGVTIDPQSLLRNLGFENGIPGVIADMNAFRSMTPKDTPESSKDGASEPTSDISDGATLDIDLAWQSLDSDLLFNLDNASLEGDMPALDAIIDPTSLANRGPGGLALAEWDEMEIDFSKPFQFDTSLYSMAV